MKKFISIVSIGLLLLTSIYLGFNLQQIHVLPNMYFIGVCVGLFLLFLFLAIISFKCKGWLGKIIVLLICICLSAVNMIGGFYLFKTNATLSSVTKTIESSENHISLIAMKDSSASKIEEVNGKKVGKLETLDSYATEQMLHEMNEQAISYETADFATLDELVNALYTSQVDLIIFNESYRTTIQDMDSYANFDTETKVIHSLEYEVEVVENENKIEDITTTPFNVLITGTDSRYGVYATSRSDVNMVATINPNTSIVLLTSIPRDYYVPEVCSAAEGCPNGQMDKLTHTGNHGMNCVRQTIESFMGIKINYTLKVSFESVTQLVDAIGGIDVYSDQTIDRPGYGGNACVVTEGMNHMDGACALAFARERYAYAEGDRHRIKNQQDVLIAIAKKVLSPSMIINYASFMDALDGTFITDISITDIQKLIQFQIEKNPSWTFEQYSLNGTGDWGYSAEMGQDLYMMYPDESTIKNGREKIEAVLSGKSSNDVDTVTNKKENEVKEGWQGY